MTEYTPKFNKAFEEVVMLEGGVDKEDVYKSWAMNRFEKVRNPDTAALLFVTYRQTGSIRLVIKLIQYALKSYGFDIDVTGEWCSETMKCLNKAKQIGFVSAFRSELASHYRQIKTSDNIVDSAYKLCREKAIYHAYHGRPKNV